MDLPRELIARIKTLTPGQLRELLEPLGPDEQASILDALLSDEGAPPSLPPKPRGRPRLHTSEERAALQREKNRRRAKEVTRAGQDIGQIPRCVDPSRRLAASKSVVQYALTYHRTLVHAELAEYHHILARKAELVVHEGGWFAMAFPRGGGKSTWCEIVVEWALLNGYKRWPLLIHATEPLSLQSFKNIKTSLSGNQLLAQDYPESVYPLQKLEGSARMAEGQRCCGEKTDVYLGADRLVLPTIPPEELDRWAKESFSDWTPRPTGGSRLTVASITGGLRGKVVTNANLERIRPDLAIADDPQTRESAKSYTQSLFRLQTLKGDIEYLSGGFGQMSLLVPGTVIYQGDMVYQMLDRSLNPEFRGETHKMMISFPSDLDFWNEYRDLRRNLLLSDSSMVPLNDFYLANRDRADAGAVVSWPALFNKSEVSGIQHAMNLYLKDPEAFASEAQNDPITDNSGDQILTPVEAMVIKQSLVPQGTVPAHCTKLAAHIDVQGNILFWSLLGSSSTFEVSVIDYGSYPDQKRWYYALSESLKGYDTEFPADAPLIQMYRAIQVLITILASRKFTREDGLEMSIDKILVDCNYEGSTVIKACSDSPFSGIVIPSTGFGVRARDIPMALRPRKAGETKGHEWIIKPKPDTPRIQYVQMNVNAWKVTLHQMFRTAIGPGSISFWKDNPHRHRMAAEHCNAETARLVTVGERSCVEFEEKPNHPDNHFFDTFVGSLVGLSILGCSVPNAQETELSDRRRTPKVVSRAALQARGRA